MQFAQRVYPVVKIKNFLHYYGRLDKMRNTLSFRYFQERRLIRMFTIPIHFSDIPRWTNTSAVYYCKNSKIGQSAFSLHVVSRRTRFLKQSKYNKMKRARCESSKFFEDREYFWWQRKVFVIRFSYARCLENDVVNFEQDKLATASPISESTQKLPSFLYSVNPFPHALEIVRSDRSFHTRTITERWLHTAGFDRRNSRLFFQEWENGNGSEYSPTFLRSDSPSLLALWPLT